MLEIHVCPGNCHVCFYLRDIHNNFISKMYWAKESNEISIYPAGAAMWANEEYWEGA